MDLELAEKRVLVTGSTRGIGHGIAHAFLCEGARVAITARDAKRLDEVTRQWRDRFGRQQVVASPGDIGKLTSVTRVLKRMTATWGGLDVLVLNVGSGSASLGLKPKRSEWARILDINLVGAMEVVRLVAPALSRGKEPAVLFVGSIAGSEVIAAPMPYGAAKAALRHAMKSLARHLAEDGIRVNMVAPGNVLFPGGAWDRKLRESSTATREMLRREVPMKRFGTVEEIAAAALFLCSPRASFITGSCLNVDGGQTRGF